MADTCPGFSPKADVAFDADCKHCGEKHAAHDTCAYVPNDRASGGPCNHCQACGAPRAEHTNYRVGDLLTLKSGAQWRVRKQYTCDNGRASVALVDPLNPNHGTAFYADVLDTLVVAEPFTESGDYPAGTDFVVSAHVDRGAPLVSVSSAHVARTFLHLTTASAREVAAALLIAADHADRDAKVTVHADATGTFTIPKAGVWQIGPAALPIVTRPLSGAETVKVKEAWLQHCREAQERQHIFTSANRETTGGEETEECGYPHGVRDGAPVCLGDATGKEESDQERRARKAKLFRQAYTPAPGYRVFPHSADGEAPTDESPAERAARVITNAADALDLEEYRGH